MSTSHGQSHTKTSTEIRSRVSARNLSQMPNSRKHYCSKQLSEKIEHYYEVLLVLKYMHCGTHFNEVSIFIYILHYPSTLTSKLTRILEFHSNSFSVGFQ